jgi:hypothetical protein
MSDVSANERFAHESPWSAERCARILEKPKQSPTGWKACCPVHEDKDPSLFLADGADGLALVCYAGCDYKSIAQALEAKGAVLSPNSRDRKSIPAEHFQLGAYHAHWDYRDGIGNVVMRVCRWEQPGGKKDIRPLIKTVDGWKWGHHPNPRPLFQLDRLTNEPEKPVLLVEGEKTAVAAQKLFPDHIATTWPGGAASMGQADISMLMDRDVTLIPDCDAPGRKAMAWMFNRLKASARAVRIIDPTQIVKDLPDGWDLADALSEKRDVSAWLARGERTEAKPSGIVIKSADQLAAAIHTAVWLLKPYLERNSSVLLFGDLGTLKSFLALLWGLSVALLGYPVIYLSAEGKGLGKRIKGFARDKFGNEWQMRLQRLPFFGIEQPLNLSADTVVGNLLKAIEDGCIEPALIIIDTISKNSDGRVEASTEDATAYLNLLDIELRDRFKCCLIYVHHTGHAEKSRARGPYALMANTDAAFRIERPDLEQLVVTVTAGRMKDCEPPAPFSLAARKVQTGDLDEDGNPITTLILEPSETVPAKPKRPTGRAQKSILSALERAQKSGDGPPVWTIDEVRQIAKGLEIAKSSARDAIATLIESGFLKQQIGGLALGYQP